MNIPPYAAAAAKLLRRHLPGAAGTLGDEARGIATIERAMRARNRQRRFLTLGASLAAAAAVIIVGSKLRKWREPSLGSRPVSISVIPSGQGAAVARNEGKAPLKAQSAIESGQRIETPEAGGASLQLSTGTSMTLSGRTSFRVDSQGATQRFTLQRGEVVAHVAKLVASQRFIVDTPDAEVEVRGTRFHLRVVEQGESCGAGTRTRLEVSEGVVEVRVAGQDAISVKAGQIWPAGCSRAVDMPPSPGLAPSGPSVASAPKRDVHPVTPAVRAVANEIEAERVSGLTAQNDLFADGVARARQGDTSGALRAYQELISRFPSSALAENAMVARMRLLAPTADGANEAKRYLARYPRGFAVREAKKLAAEP